MSHHNDMVVAASRSKALEEMLMLQDMIGDMDTPDFMSSEFFDSVRSMERSRNVLDDDDLFVDPDAIAAAAFDYPCASSDDGSSGSDGLSAHSPSQGAEIEGGGDLVGGAQSLMTSGAGARLGNGEGSVCSMPSPSTGSSASSENGDLYTSGSCDPSENGITLFGNDDHSTFITDLMPFFNSESQLKNLQIANIIGAKSATQAPSLVKPASATSAPIVLPSRKLSATHGAAITTVNGKMMVRRTPGTLTTTTPATTKKPILLTKSSTVAAAVKTTAQPQQKSQVIRVQSISGNGRSLLLPVNLKNIKIVNANSLKQIIPQTTTTQLSGQVKQQKQTTQPPVMRKINVEKYAPSLTDSADDDMEIEPPIETGVPGKRGYPPLVLSNEERRLLYKEGIQLPTHYPLTKHEEKELKRIRRKIRNKISAQDSRKRKKEYVDQLEEKARRTCEENEFLKKRIRLLRRQNTKLMEQMRRLQEVLFNNTSSKATPTTCLMIVLFSTLLVCLPNIRLADRTAQQLDIADQQAQQLVAARRALLYSHKASAEEDGINMEDYLVFNKGADDEDGANDSAVAVAAVTAGSTPYVDDIGKRGSGGDTPDDSNATARAMAKAFTLASVNAIKPQLPSTGDGGGGGGGGGNNAQFAKFLDQLAIKYEELATATDGSARGCFGSGGSPGAVDDPAQNTSLHEFCLKYESDLRSVVNNMKNILQQQQEFDDDIKSEDELSNSETAVNTAPTSNQRRELLATSEFIEPEIDDDDDAGSYYNQQQVPVVSPSSVKSEMSGANALVQDEDELMLSDDEDDVDDDEEVVMEFGAFKRQFMWDEDDDHHVDMPVVKKTRGGLHAAQVAALVDAAGRYSMHQQ